MPSARLFVLRQGDGAPSVGARADTVAAAALTPARRRRLVAVLVMPAGTYHYVYTITRKLVLAGDFLNASGWRTRIASIEAFGADRNHEHHLAEVVAHGLVHVEKARAVAALQKDQALSHERHAHLEQALAWHDELVREGGPSARAMERANVREAVELVRRCERERRPTTT